MIDFDKMKRNISFSDLLEIIDKSNGEKCVFENLIIGTGDGKNRINFEILENLTFINCLFNDINLSKCEISDCHFIDCRVYDSCINNNRFRHCEIANVELANNTYVYSNICDGLVGYLNEFCWCIENQYNTFMNMDFSGFLPVYTCCGSGIGEGYMICGKNFFHNTTVSLEALEKLSNRADHLGRTRESSAPIELIRTISEDEKEGGGIIKDKLGIAEYFIPFKFFIDLKGMDPEAKLNLVASAVTNLYDGSYFRVSLNGRNLDDSFFTFYSTPNPASAKIVDSRGFSLKPGVIKDINIRKNFAIEHQKLCYYDGNEFAHNYTEDNSLHNPDNYECKQLIKI